MLKQILRLIKLLGLRRAVRMKKHHEVGLGYIRGYAATECWWTLLELGFLDELQSHGHIDIAAYAQTRGLDTKVFQAIIDYLDGIGLLERRDSAVRLGRRGAVLLAEPRGLFELGQAYEPCFRHLPDLLTGRKTYGQDVRRSIKHVGIGSGRLCEQLPYPVMRQMVLEHGCRMVLDLGCGDMALLAGLCRMHGEIRCHGIDCDAEMIAFDMEQLEHNDYQGRLTADRADMFALDHSSAKLPDVDCITACDTFHEYMHEPERIVRLLHKLRDQFPRAIFVIGEFCLQDAHWLRKHPTASLEHHLFHDLSLQQIGTAAQWRDIFAHAGLQIIEEQVYDMIGHGYFALR